MNEILIKYKRELEDNEKYINTVIEKNKVGKEAVSLYSSVSFFLNYGNLNNQNKNVDGLLIPPPFSCMIKALMIQKLFQMYVKLFIDSDAASTKVLLNLLNQNRPNSADKHLCWLFAECQDKEANIQMFFDDILNSQLEAFVCSHSGADNDTEMLLSCDLKQGWQVNFIHDHSKLLL